MGNLKTIVKGTKGGPNADAKMNQDPAPVKTDEPGTTTGETKNENNDLPLKRKLAEYLLSSDLNVFKKHLGDVRNLSDEKFNELFEGNTEYVYGVQDEKSFRQLAQKFEDNKDLLYECYGNDEYFKYALQIWKPNILQGLKEADGDSKKSEILRRYKIDVSTWESAFQEIFNIIINQPPIKSLAERMVNYMATNYGDFDELIKNVDKSKKNMEKDKNSCNNKAITSNLEASMTKIIDVFVPNFLKQLSEGASQVPTNIKKIEKNRAINQILKTGNISWNNKKKLINSVKKIYKEGNKEVSWLGFNEESKKLQKLSQRFNEKVVKETAFEGTIHFKEMGFKDKAGIAFSNKMIKHAVLGLSMANLTYSVMHLSQTFMDYKMLDQQFQFRLDELRKKFDRHRKEVQIITEETDIDKAVNLVIESGKKFNQDLDEVEDLINDIQYAIDGVKTDTNNSILNLIGSGGGLVISAFGAAVTKGNDRAEYGASSLANVLGFVTSAVDISEKKKIIKKYGEYFKQAIELKNSIICEIDKLRDKFYELSNQHYT